ncbi:MAG: hypothetical protein NC824_03950, partial [Candidatus Omnitrophica bacterium]|nr:hypothetical protein [Candidatus Omnitrophota bacterium]
MRIGDYRVIYWIEKDIVWIIAVRHRKGIYEGARYIRRINLPAKSLVAAFLFTISPFTFPLMQYTLLFLKIS